MGTQDVYLTRAGYEKLRARLEYLKTTKRRQLSREIKKAREHGDLSENAEYDAAKNAQGYNEKDIAELEAKLQHGRILDDENIPKDEVLIGATVKLEDTGTGAKLKYTLVSDVEADYEEGKISVTSPVGRTLLGHKENETVKIEIPAGTLIYKILKITR
ncbi:transcription elongation factor GreA [Candidatus Omnitrophota bacterium]